MTELSTRDLQAALEFVGEAYSFEDLETFRTGILPGLERLVPSDLFGYNEVYAAGEPALVLTYPDPPLDFAGEVLAQFAHQHPLIAVQANGDDGTYKISDFLSRREYHALELYDELYRHLGAEDQIAFGLPGPTVIGIAMNRDRRSFSERDRALLELLRPHLARARDRILERERRDALVAVLERGLAESDAAVLALDRAGAVLAASGAALELVGAYFPGGREGSLPVAVAEWLDGGAIGDRAPLTTTGERGRLTVREVTGSGDGTLLVFEEQRTVTAAALRPLGLTQRQAEVLSLLATGSGIEEIATLLFVSPRTVRKHVEHIYERLGVHSRGEAVAAALEAARRPGTTT